MGYIACFPNKTLYNPLLAKVCSGVIMLIENYSPTELYPLFLMPQQDYDSTDNKRLTRRQAVDQILSLGGALVITQIIAMGSHFIESLMTSRLGESELAAIGLIGPVQSFVTYFVAGQVAATSILGRGKIRSNRPDIAGQIQRDSWRIAAATSLPAIVLYVSMQPIMRASRQPHDVARLIGSYFQVYSAGVPALFMVMSSKQFLVSANYKKMMIASTVFQKGITLLAAYAFMFGKCGSPKLGLTGLAYANTLGNWCSLLAVILYYAQEKSLKKYKLLRRNNELDSTVRELLKVGLPIAVRISMEYLSLLFCMSMVGTLGRDALVSAAITNRYLAMFLLPGASIAQASSMLVRSEKVASNSANARQYGNLGIAMSTIMPCIALVLLGFFSEQLIAVFMSATDDHDKAAITATAKNLLFITNAALIDSVRVASDGALRGFLDTDYSMKVSLASMFFVTAPLAYLASLELGPEGVFAAHVIGIAICAALLLGRWNYISKSNKPAMLRNYPGSFWQRAPGGRPQLQLATPLAAGSIKNTYSGFRFSSE
jgi:MATE family multidrug resistance protein